MEITHLHVSFWSRWADAEEHQERAQDLFDTDVIADLFGEQQFSSVMFTDVVHASEVSSNMELKTMFARIPQVPGSTRVGGVNCVRLSALCREYEFIMKWIPRILSQVT